MSPSIEPLRIAVLCPHFAPDTAPTGEVITRIVAELAALGHELHVVTALPWYREHRIEQGWQGRAVRREATPWGSITRVNPFPGDDKRNLVRRAAGFAGFSALAGLSSLRGGRVDAVIAMSPPLTMGLTGWGTHLVRRGPLVFNIQDVFPDAAVETGAITNRHIIGLARWLERVSYHRAAAITVLSDDLRDNVAAKMRPTRRDRVHVIPNFVDTEFIQPADRMTGLRTELGIGTEPVVLYAGNVGFSQSLEMVVDAARDVPQATFLINGDGAARASLEQRAAGLPNVRFSGYQPRLRVPEVLATGDVHLVPLKQGLGRVSVPSKTYSILAAGRPVLAAIDPDTEVPRMLAASGGGLAVPPDDPAAFVTALRQLLAEPAAAAAMGAAGREWVLGAASPRAVAIAYEQLVRSLGSPRRRSAFGSASR
ncbi:MAG TPA: glycosyltransferase family 4 protein [Ilumatobacteraceae bacterium]|jgi:colanic acid biosynthesis glycosyl transferase WcaI|nr:glycosyltransferase family 4 protein [Ilumatobacteraceae bacterium]